MNLLLVTMPVWADTPPEIITLITGLAGMAALTIKGARDLAQGLIRKAKLEQLVDQAEPLLWLAEHQDEIEDLVEGRSTCKPHSNARKPK